MYYFNCGSKNKAINIFVFVHHKILHDYFLAKDDIGKVDDIKFSYAKLVYTQSFFISNYDENNEECVGFLTNNINAFVQCSDIIVTGFVF
jgi:hypothetical protein